MQKVLLLDHPALSMISCVETPDIDAVVEDADRVEWAENSGSNPAFSKDVFNHLAMVKKLLVDEEEPLPRKAVQQT